MKYYFTLEESPYQLGYNMIKIDEEKVHIGYTTGSRNVFMARLMGLSWANFLRLCRDKYGAKLVGKKSLYVGPYFPKDLNGGKELCKELNRRMDFIFQNLKEKES